MESIKRVVLATGLALAATFLLQPYRPVVVTGRSMTPTFRNGELVLSEPLNREPRVGDVVLVEKDGATLIKRVAMVPGDKYTEAYLRWAHTWIMVRTPTQKRLVASGAIPSRVLTVPKGQMYILGDNPEVSVDSSTFGMVPVSSIRGIVYGLS